jgi:hypothetical protein
MTAWPSARSFNRMLRWKARCVSSHAAPIGRSASAIPPSSQLMVFMSPFIETRGERTIAARTQRRPRQRANHRSSSDRRPHCIPVIELQRGRTCRYHSAGAAHLGLFKKARRVCKTNSLFEMGRSDYELRQCCFRLTSMVRTFSGSGMSVPPVFESSRVYESSATPANGGPATTPGHRNAIRRQASRRVPSLLRSIWAESQF